MGADGLPATLKQADDVEKGGRKGFRGVRLRRSGNEERRRRVEAEGEGGGKAVGGRDGGRSRAVMITREDDDQHAAREGRLSEGGERGIVGPFWCFPSVVPIRAC